jgi:hypothetical protein
MRAVAGRAGTLLGRQGRRLLSRSHLKWSASDPPAEARRLRERASARRASRQVDAMEWFSPVGRARRGLFPESTSRPAVRPHSRSCLVSSEIPRAPGLRRATRTGRCRPAGPHPCRRLSRLGSAR